LHYGAVGAFCCESEADGHLQDTVRCGLPLDEGLFRDLTLLDLGFHGWPLSRVPILFRPHGAVGFVRRDGGGELVLAGDHDAAVSQRVGEIRTGGVDILDELGSAFLPGLALRR
jgi:hypothetical protein